MAADRSDSKGIGHNHGLGIDIGDANRGHVYPSPPPDDQEPEPATSDGGERSLLVEMEEVEAVEEKDRTLKLSPARLDELLPTAPFVLQPLQSSSPTRRRRSSTNSGNEGPPATGRAKSTSASSRGSRVVTPARNPSQTSRRMEGIERRSSATSAVVHNYGGSVTFDDSTSSLEKPSTTRLLKSKSANGALFPPLPFQSYLSLALSSPTSTPSPGFINASTPGNDDASKQSGPVYGKPPHNPDDSAAIAMERIMNFFLLPPKLEGALMFGVLACLDSWLYIFTILPLRFLKAIGVLIEFWRVCIWDYFNYDGNKLRKPRKGSRLSSEDQEKRRERRKRKENKVSGLNSNHKADILRGMILFTSCWFLMRFDASKMYHSIRGQSGIKLYVMYNMLDFSDKLCAALGQDIFDVLFSRDVLDRRPDGRSKIWRPFGFFLLALAYNIVHSLVLFYQAITLNVAVNSYSNALITLLISVQFVEIKTTVFKKFEKENLFQLLCADIVERFQLLLMLIIIASRNLVELGVWSLSPSATSGGILPKSFTVFPKWTGQIMGPFVMVLGSEMVVDWLKHAYITKFNNTRPVVYGRFLDVQCKDYYSRAFADQNLTKRLGLPVLPLASLFIRATIQTYHQFLATHVPPPLPPTTSLSEETVSETSAALAGLDAILRRALSCSPEFSLLDNVVAAGTMCFFLLACFLVFLAVKLLLGVLLLGFARKRYKKMKERDRMYIHTGAMRSSAFGTVTVGEEERKVIYSGELEAEGRTVREMVRKGREKEMSVEMEGLEEVTRYRMCAKRIW